MQTEFDRHEVNTLIHLLRTRGVAYLMGSKAVDIEESKAVDPAQLIQRLVSCGYPLVGGAAMVHKGIRTGQTLDIDIQITADPANFTTHNEVYQEIPHKIGNPPYDRLLPNLSQQPFSRNHQAIRQLF